MIKLKILFVCSGNTCRSPLAAAYFKKKCVEEKLGKIDIVSAGTVAASGFSASDNSAKIAKEFGFDISGHKSRPLKPEDISAGDMIIAMTSVHKEAISAASFKGAGNKKIHLLLDFAPDGSSGDIPDPFGRNIGVYRECFLQMKPALDNLLKIIKTKKGNIKK
jgi:protein-tyrosine phosphatase